MQQVITSKQGRDILGGRAPHLPVEYETAVKALAECVTLDEAKYWDNKADALAAWAKIYRSDEAARGAKQLKLHAYRRMGQLATELRPEKGLGVPGAQSVLISTGLKKYQAKDVLAVSRTPEKQFQHLVSLPRPPSPASIGGGMAKGSAAWKLLAHPVGAHSLSNFASFCRRQPDIAALVADLTEDEASRTKKLAQVAIDWLDEFDRRLSAKLAQRSKRPAKE